jgi:fructose-bisphosphate aldolase class II
VLKVDGDVGRKKDYDPRSWGRAAEASMTHRVKLACEDPISAGKHMS